MQPPAEVSKVMCSYHTVGDQLAFTCSLSCTFCISKSLAFLVTSLMTRQVACTLIICNGTFGQSSIISIIGGSAI